MELYRNQHEVLKDCDPTIKLINRFQKLIIAMSSRTIFNALTQDSDSSKVLDNQTKYNIL